MNKHTFNTSTTSSAPIVSLPIVTPAGGYDVVVPGGSTRTAEAALEALERAVYAHIQALRALGRVSVNTTEIAAALNVPVSDIESTVNSLLRKGVKVAP